MTRRILRKLVNKTASNKTKISDLFGHRISVHLYQLSRSPRFVEYAWVLENLDLEEGSILDVGCAKTLFPIMLASLGYTVTGIDLAEYHWTHPNFNFIRCDVMDLPAFVKQKFNRIVSISTLEHIGLWQIKNQDPEGDFKAIKTMERLLKPDGMMLITLPYGPKLDVSNVFEKGRVYDADRLRRVLQGFGVTKKDLFMRMNRLWAPCSEDDVMNLHEESDLPYALVCMKGELP